MRTVALLTIGCVVFAAGTRADDPPKPKEKVFEFTGRTEAVARVDIRARVTGYIDKIAAEEGDTVKAGTLLVEIDPRPYKAQCDAAKAQVVRAEARVKLADAKLARLKKAVATGAVAKEELDEAMADREVAVAELAADKAALDLANLNLAYTKIHAPIDGRVTHWKLTPGNLAVADTSLLATIVRTDTLIVAFDVDERSLSKLLDAKGKDGKFAVAVGFSGDEGFPHTAEFRGMDSAVDPNTGTIRMRATLANPKGTLLPGMFVRVRVTPPPGK